MAIDPFAEKMISLTQAAKLFPGRPHVATLHRWAARRTNPLEVYRSGGRRFTSVEAVKRFLHNCNEATPAPMPSGAGRAARDLRAVDAHLRAEGILP